MARVHDGSIREERILAEGHHLERLVMLVMIDQAIMVLTKAVKKLLAHLQGVIMMDAKGDIGIVIASNDIGLIEALLATQHNGQ